MKRKDAEEALIKAANSMKIEDDLEDTFRLVKANSPLTSPVPEPEARKRKGRAYRGILVFGAAASVACVGLFVGLSFIPPANVPSVSVSGSQSTEIPATSMPTPSTLSNEEANAFAKQAVSLLSLASSFSGDAAPISKGSRLNARFDRGDNADFSLSDTQKNEIAADIDSFIYMVEEFSRSDSFVIDLVSDDTSIRVEDGSDVYLIDYQETQISAAVSLFEGTISFDGSSVYRFEGTIEEKGAEKEVEMCLDLEGITIKVEQEIEQGENEYSYSFIKDGESKPYRSVEFEREIEGRENESSIEIEEGGLKRSCEFEHLDGDGLGDHFRAEYEKEEMGGAEIEAEVYVRKTGEGSHSYTFGDGYVTNIDRR